MVNISFVELKYNTIPIGDVPAGKLLRDGLTTCDMYAKNLRGGGGRGRGGGRASWGGGKDEATQMRMKHNNIPKEHIDQPHAKHERQAMTLTQNLRRIVGHLLYHRPDAPVSRERTLYCSNARFAYARNNARARRFEHSTHLSPEHFEHYWEGQECSKSWSKHAP